MLNLNLFRRWTIPTLILGSFIFSLSISNWSVKDLFLTPDQQGRLLMAEGEFKAAANVFQDPLLKGTALYRNGDFKAAAAAFGRDDTIEAVYNRGNALLMQGEYDVAIAAYETALSLKQGWPEAEENMALAQARKEMKALPEDDAGGTGGQLEADEIIFDARAENNSHAEQEIILEGNQMSDKEMRAIWLRRVQTKPADFLRSKFAYQNAMDQTIENNR